MRSKQAGYTGTCLGERSESVTPAAGERFLGLTARRTSRCNLAIAISFVPSSQSTLNFNVLREKQVDFLLFNLLRPGTGATRLVVCKIVIPYRGARAWPSARASKGILQTTRLAGEPFF